MAVLDLLSDPIDFYYEYEYFENDRYAIYCITVETLEYMYEQYNILTTILFKANYVVVNSLAQWNAY